MATNQQITGVIDAPAEDVYIEISGNARTDVRRELKLFETNVEKENALLFAGIDKINAERSTLSKLRQVELMENEIKNLSGMFSTYERNVLRQARMLSYKIQQRIYEDDLERELGFDDQTLYTWEAVFVNTCPSCIELHGTTKTRAAWDQVGAPKIYPTVCDGNCRCILVPNEAMPSKAENRKPIMIEADRIRRTEIKRGKEYSPSYKSQILGNLNNEEFRKTMRDLRKVKKVT